MSEIENMLKRFSAFTLSDGEFKVDHERNAFDDDGDETEDTVVKLYDGDGDGVLTISYRPNHFGIGIRLTNLMTDESVEVPFTKNELKTFLEVLNASFKLFDEKDEEDA